MLLDSLPCTARVFLLLSNFRNMLRKAKPSLPSLRSFFFLMFRDFLPCRCQGDEWNTELENVAKLPAFISSCLLLEITWNATIQSQGHFGSYTGELGQPRTKPWTDVGCACFPVHRDTKSLLNCSDIWDRLLKHANMTWWDIKIRLLRHVAPQRKDFWDTGIISLSLSNLITCSRDGISTYFVSCQSLISSKGSVSPWLDFVSLSRGCVCIYIIHLSPVKCQRRR